MSRPLQIRALPDREPPLPAAQCAFTQRGLKPVTAVSFPHTMIGDITMNIYELGSVLQDTKFQGTYPGDSNLGLAA